MPATKTKTEKAIAKQELSSFDTWSDEEKAEWAAKNTGELELFPEDLIEPDGGLILDAETATLLGRELLDEEAEFGKLSEVLQPQGTESRIDRIVKAFDSVKTVQGIVSISRVTTVKNEGWKCIHRELLDRDSDAEVTTTAPNANEIIGRIFNDLVPHLIELGGLDKLIWGQAEITKVAFPVKKGDKTTNLVISGINPGRYGRQSICVSVVFIECPPGTQLIIQTLEAAVSFWLEDRLLKAKKKPLQTNLFELEPLEAV